jgi:hypothetical protein
MIINKFDVYEACYVYAMENSCGVFCKAYQLFGKLIKKGFNPSLFVKEKGYSALSEEGKKIYNIMKQKNY